MYTAKGFVTHSQFVNNTVGVVAPLGEISTNSRTFSKEKGEYTNDTYPKVTHVNFLSVNESTNIVVPNDISTSILKIANYIYNNTLTNSGEIFIDVLLQSLITAFASEATDFAAGQMVTDGTYWVPEWVSWANTTNTTYAENTIKIWLVDASFQAQYENYEYTVVFPFDTLDDFFNKTPAAIRTALAAMTDDVKAQRIQIARGIYPDTITWIDMFSYVDPTNTANKTPAPWVSLIYGAAGNNIDSRKANLQDVILASSSHDRDDWIKIFPDIFKRTEMIGVPMWQREAIPNRPSTPGIYSPVTDYVKDRALVKKILTDYTSAHIDANLQAFGVNYKSLLVTMIGNLENRDGLYRFNDIFGDYINVALESTDFNRMSDLTAAWVQAYIPLIILAETATQYTSLPAGVTRVTRNGILFLVRSYNNVQYLVATKASVLANQ